MSQPVADLVQLLELEQIDTNLYRGAQPRTERQRMFGGQVLAQALSASWQTVPGDRFVHSLHAYFILPGDTSRPVVFDVERLRDGGSFTTRRTAARQGGRPIFYLTASFQVNEPGPEHQDTMPETDAPESYPLMVDYVIMDGVRKMVQDPGFAGIEARVVPVTPNPPRSGSTESISQVWMRTVSRLPDGDPALHTCVLAFMSDLSLLSASMVPHDLHYADGEVQVASLDHAMWFHRPFRADEWLLYDLSSPSASGARGLSFGRLFNQEGQLVATTAQEGLVRPVRPREHR